MTDRAPTEAEERGAKAAFDAVYGDVHSTSWDFMQGPVNVSGELKERYRKIARAVIRSLREPTTEMVGAGATAIRHNKFSTFGEHIDGVRASHAAMIDAASPEVK